MVDAAITDIEADGEQISCRKGCMHCCYLLVEISWEEASELANWIVGQPEASRNRLIGSIKESAADAKEFFLSDPKTAHYLEGWAEDEDLPEEIYDRYFQEKARPCPFLSFGKCEAYVARPTPCRLHMVSSEPSICSREVEDDEDYNIPDRVDELREEVGPVISAMCKDGRWGLLSLLVQEALVEKGLLKQDLGSVKAVS